MKIAVPTRGTVVDDHFGHCEKYTVFTIDKNVITAEDSLPSPQGCGCKSNIGPLLQQLGVTVLLAGNMGEGALRVLSNCGINVYRGNTGDTRRLVESFLKGEIRDSGSGCDHHQGADCGH